MRDKRGFKYNLGVVVTLKRWIDANNGYDISTITIKAKVITVINQRFNLNSPYEKI